MPTITLPDNTQKQFDHPVSVLAVAQHIGAGLAKATIAGLVNDELVDATFQIDHDAKLTIITVRDEAGLDIIRHSTAHLLAQAVKAIFPTVQVTIGPVIENGFYYDFAFGRAFTPEDLEKIEKKMQEIAKKDLPVVRRVMSREEAINYFEGIGEHYKVEIIRDIPAGEDLSIYEQGDFVDLCRGPHVPSTAKLGVFKLMKVAGAYWRGDSNNEMLQRIYGTAWGDKKGLKEYLKRIEEAEKRDHRKLAKKLGLYHLQEESPGMAFWHDKGWKLYKTVENYVRDLLNEHGYQEVNTPIVVDRSLWEKSGHWDKFSEEMFTTNSEDREYAIKPMNCPCHIQIYKQGLKSYRDLPLRIAEFGHCHRSEPSGALHGLMRARSFTQDDAHIFCTEDQIQAEVATCIDFLYQVYTDFGFDDLIVKLSTRPEDRIGADAIWDKAESALEESLNSKKINWALQPGEGAFYGPKIEFALKDCLGRVWQCGTIQIDFSMPERLEAEYVAEDGSRKTPVMIHRAILGSMERFIAILIEHYEGLFPLWLAPVQAVVMNITDNQAEYCTKVAETLKKQGIRAISDLRNEKIGFKIREHTIQRVPYLFIIGDKELATEMVAVRTKAGDDLGSMPLADAMKKLHVDIAEKR